MKYPVTLYSNHFYEQQNINRPGFDFIHRSRQFEACEINKLGKKMPASWIKKQNASLDFVFRNTHVEGFKTP